MALRQWHPAFRWLGVLRISHGQSSQIYKSEILTAFYPNPIRYFFLRCEKVCLHSRTDDLVNNQHQVCTNADLTASPRKFDSIKPERRSTGYRYACKTASAHFSYEVMAGSKT
jgi:hypothetical protein